MKARVSTLATLLSTDAVYETPFFQRPYRWRRRNWIAFWNGWARTAEIDEDEAAEDVAVEDLAVDDLGAAENEPEAGFAEDPPETEERPETRERPEEVSWEEDAAEPRIVDADPTNGQHPVEPDRMRLQPVQRHAPPRGDARRFLGAIVLQERLAPAQFDILDGQQRLLTACAAIRALILAAEDLGAPETAARLDALLHPTGSTETPVRCRVVAARASLDDQSAALTATPEALERAAERYEEGPDSVALQTATGFFLERIRVQMRLNDPGLALSALACGLLERTDLVVIEIDAAMSAFDVFETLNNLGEPLSTLDLVKNRLFDLASHDPTAGAEGRSAEGLLRLYHRHWSAFDDPETLDFWGASVPRGGDRRLNQDWFLRSYLSARLGREVRGSEIHDQLSVLLETSDADGAEHIAEIGRAAAAFLEIGGHAAAERHADRIAALRLYGNVATEPALIAIHMHLWDDAEAAEAVLDMLESCVVRRFFTKADGSGYGEFARIAGLIGPGAAARGPQVVAAVRQRLQAAERGRFWPSDKAFRKGFCARELVARGGATLKRNGKPIFFHVYEKLDAAARAAEARPPERSEEFDSPDISVEHLYPLYGRKHWPEPKRTEAPWLRTIGNLAAIPVELNRRLGQWRWEEKRDALREESDIHLNRLLYADPRWTNWSVRKIKQRGDDLADLAIQVWRRPT